MEATLSSPQNRVQGFWRRNVSPSWGMRSMADASSTVSLSWSSVFELGRLPGHRHVRRAARIRSGRGGEPVRPIRPPRGESARPAIDPRGLPGRAAQVAGRGRDPSEWLGAAGGVRRLRRRAPVRPGSLRARHFFGVPERPGPPGRPEAARVPGLRCPVYARAPPGGTHGLVGRSLRRTAGYRRMRDADASTLEPHS
jgi:hypothetical protein